MKLSEVIKYPSNAIELTKLDDADAEQFAHAVSVGQHDVHIEGRPVEEVFMQALDDIRDNANDNPSSYFGDDFDGFEILDKDDDITVLFKHLYYSQKDKKIYGLIYLEVWAVEDHDDDDARSNGTKQKEEFNDTVLVEMTGQGHEHSSLEHPRDPHDIDLVKLFPNYCVDDAT